jgi:thiamine biosynthesis lipoprotein
MGSHHHQSHPTSLYTYSGKAQGTTYSIKYRSPYESVSQAQIDSLFNVFDQSLSRYNPNSLLSQINSAKKTAPLDSHLLEVINFATHLEADTDRAFSISLLPLLKLWGFSGNKPSNKPNPVSVNKTLEITRNNKYTINGLRIFKSNRKTALDLDGVAQGYCVDFFSSFFSCFTVVHHVYEGPFPRP